MKHNRLTTRHFFAVALICAVAVYGVVFAQATVNEPIVSVDHASISMTIEAITPDHCQLSANQQDCESCKDIHCPCGHIALPSLIDIALLSGNEHSTAEPPRLKPIAYSMTLDRPPSA